MDEYGSEIIINSGRECALTMRTSANYVKTKSNAGLIVKAVNSHDRMLKMLINIKESVKTGEFTQVDPLFDELEELINEIK